MARRGWSRRLRMAESLVRDSPARRFTCSATARCRSWRNSRTRRCRWCIHEVGKGANNLGITALDVRANPENPRQRAVYVSVANFSTNAVQTELELLLDGRLLETRPLTIPAGRNFAPGLLRDQTRDGVFTVRLTGKDDSGRRQPGLDRQPAAQAGEGAAGHRGNRLLEKALRAVAERAAGDGQRPDRPGRRIRFRGAR